MGRHLNLILALALIVALLTIEPLTAHADTNVSGPITSNTTWTLAGSPYIVVGNVLVFEGVTLTIEPGVVVKFDADKALQVDGELIAQGTGDNPITFTSNMGNDPGDWGYVLFTDSSVDATYDGDGNYLSGSIIQHAVIEYAGGVSVSNNGAIRIDASSPLIDHSTVQHNASSGINVFNNAGPKIANNTITDNSTSGSGGGILASGGTVTISDNTISDNSASRGGGIYASSSTVTINNNTISGNSASNEGGGIYSTYGTMTISNNTISDNSASYSYGGGIFAYRGAVTISNNTITGNSTTGSSRHGGGIYASGGTVTISNNTISDNSASGDGGGIYASGDTVTVSKNVVADNSASGYGGGICAGRTAVTHNTIIRNTLDGSTRGAGVYWGAGDNDFSHNTLIGNVPSPGDDASAVFINSGFPAFNHNNIYDNPGYELYNNNAQGSPNLDAENCWWGTTNEATIQAEIYDWFDDSTKALVDYAPYLTAHDTDAPISPPTGLAATPGGTSITLSWSANLESDLAGYKVYYDTDAAGFPYDGTGANEGPSPIDAGNVTGFSLTGLVSGTYHVSVTAYDTAADGEDDQTDGNESWFAEDMEVEVEIVPPLHVSKTDRPDPVVAGGLLTYTLVAQNTGNVAFTGVTITDTIPAHTRFAAASAGGLPMGSQSVPGGTSPPGNYVQWSGQTLPAGGGLTVTLVVRVDSLLPASTVITNAGYGATCAEGEVASGSPVTTAVQPVPVLRISKADSPDPVAAGNMLTYTLTVQNIGYADATGVTISDTVPLSTTFVSADSGGALVGDQVQWTGKTVGAGGSLTVRFTVRVEGPPDGPPIVNWYYGVTCAEVPRPVMGPPVTTWRQVPGQPSTPGG